MNQWLAGYLFNDYPPISISSWGILLLVFTTFFTLIVIFRSRIIKTRRGRLQEKYRAEYENLLTSFVFEEEEYAVDSDAYNDLIKKIKKDARRELRREVIIKILLLLKRDFKGVPEARMEQLYKDTGLEKYAFRTIRYGSWYEKAFEFTELGQMNVSSGLKLVLEYVNHYNTILREEAQFAAVRMGGVENLNFLVDVRTPLSVWQQTRMMQELEQFPLEDIPSFYFLLKARNDTIVVFGLKLIAKYRQSDENSEVTGLLVHEDERVRMAALRCLVDIDHYPAADVIVEVIHAQEEEDIPEFLLAIGTLGNEEHIPTVRDFLKNDTYEIIMASMKALIKLGYSLPADTQYPDYFKEIYKHARYELIP